MGKNKNPGGLVLDKLVTTILEVEGIGWQDKEYKGIYNKIKRRQNKIPLLKLQELELRGEKLLEEFRKSLTIPLF